MTVSRFPRIALSLVLLGGCVFPAKYERVDVTLERIALRDAWLETAVPFALALCLVLLLVVLYYRRNGPDALDGLFKPRRAPDVVGALRTWWKNRTELAPFEDLLRLQRRRVREAERTAKREAQLGAEREADRAEREARRLADEAQRELPPLGPPTLGFFSRFGVGFAVGLALTVLIVLPLASADTGGSGAGTGALIAILLGGVGAFISLIASLVCAALVSAATDKTIWRSMAWGAVGAMAALAAAPELWAIAKPIIVLPVGLAIGLAIGTADQASRKPEADVRREQASLVS